MMCSLLVVVLAVALRAAAGTKAALDQPQRLCGLTLSGDNGLTELSRLSGLTSTGSLPEPRRATRQLTLAVQSTPAQRLCSSE